MKEKIAFVFLTYWATIIIVRSFIFERFLFNGFGPMISVDGFHFHHFFFGIIFLFLAVFLYLIQKKGNLPVLFFIGLGFALLFDEFTFWTTFSFNNYWSGLNFLAFSLFGILLMLIFSFAEEKERIRKISNPKTFHQNPETPLVSVVIPAFNEENFLPETLKSLINQDFSNFEIIVVDNNSSDHTAELAKRYGAKVVFEPKRGVCTARQAGTKAARGDIIISTDADTIFAPDWLSRIWKGFLQDSEIVAISGTCRFINAPWWGSFYTVVLFGSVKILYHLIGRVWYATGCNVAFRKKFWSGYNTKLTQGGDEFGLLNELRKRGKVKFLSDNTVFTSSRRLGKGLFYNLITTVFLYYIFDYAIGLVIGRSLLGSYPAFRNNEAKVNHNWAILRPIMAAVFISIIFLSVAHTTFAHKIAGNMNYRLDSFEDKMSWRH